MGIWISKILDFVIYEAASTILVPILSQITSLRIFHSCTENSLPLTSLYSLSLLLIPF
jgi:hypothetical protein